jgi:uncharacterized protein (TIGR03435 family)
MRTPVVPRTIRMLAAAALVLIPAWSTAQTTAPVPAASFDVVSVKESAPRPVNGGVMTRPGSPDPGGGWSARNATLLMLLQRAFPDFAKPGMIVDLPAWVDQRRFDIDAKAEKPPDRSQYPALLQRLLADRFSLKTHLERRPIDTYWLVTARSDGRLGSRLRPASPECLAELEAERERMATRTGPITISSSDIGPCGRHTNLGPVLHLIDARPIASLAGAIQAYTNQLVIDRTGLDGVYQYDLEFDYAGSRGVSTATDSGAGGPSIFAAVQEQLGLKLERHRDPIEVVVVDAVTLPTAN